jgi:hypothetical protein
MPGAIKKCMDANRAGMPQATFQPFIRNPENGDMAPPPGGRVFIHLNKKSNILKPLKSW